MKYKIIINDRPTKYLSKLPNTEYLKNSKISKKILSWASPWSQDLQEPGAYESANTEYYIRL
ncbi:MAG: hypothetical protein ACI83O_000510 [Patescibacteria group bacterium]|jgi:hypothetical protein